jgi:hypothetical protein
MIKSLLVVTASSPEACTLEELGLGDKEGAKSRIGE